MTRRSLTGGGVRRPLLLRAGYACRIILALIAFTSTPAAVQTMTISASGNFGTSGNRNGDRETSWPRLQVDEGDTVTFRAEINPASGLRYFRTAWSVPSPTRRI